LIEAILMEAATGRRRMPIEDRSDPSQTKAISTRQGPPVRESAMRYLVVLAGLVGLLAAAPETVHKNIKIANPRVQETSGPRAVLHVTIANIQGRADRLLRASTPVAQSVAIWDQLGKQGAGLRIPGRAEFVIGSDLPRIELVGLTKTLSADASFNLLLVFEQAGKISVDVLVETASAIQQ
jgi:copper(I)-binding protein